MKKTICLVSSILFFSCSSSKIEKRVLNDFINEQFIKDKNIKIVIEESINPILPLEFYEKAYQDRNISLEDSIRIRPESTPPFKWPIDTLEIKKLKEKLKNNTLHYSWKKRDFYNPKFQLVDAKALKSPKNKVYEKYAGSNGLMLSRPIVTSNNKYAFLFYSTVVGGGLGSKIYSAILMENKNGKWKTIESYSEFNTSYD